MAGSEKSLPKPELNHQAPGDGPYLHKFVPGLQQWGVLL